MASTDTYLSGIISAYEKFKNQAIEEGIKSSTKASYSGSGYSVELLPSGSYRVLWDNQIGNLYKSEGVIIGIPACSSDESPSDDNDEWFVDNAVSFFEEKFNQWKSDYSDYTVN